MNIIGPDELIFGVDDVAGCAQYLTDYGLQPVGVTAGGGRFEALDGTAVGVRHAGDPSLPGAIGPAPSLRETVYGVGDEATLESIATELRSANADTSQLFLFTSREKWYPSGPPPKH